MRTKDTAFYVHSTSSAKFTGKFSEINVTLTLLWVFWFCPSEDPHSCSQRRINFSKQIIFRALGALRLQAVDWQNKKKNRIYFFFLTQNMTVVCQKFSFWKERLLSGGKIPRGVANPRDHPYVSFKTLLPLFQSIPDSKVRQNKVKIQSQDVSQQLLCDRWYAVSQMP